MVQSPPSHRPEPTARPTRLKKNGVGYPQLTTRKRTSQTVFQHPTPSSFQHPTPPQKTGTRTRDTKLKPLPDKGTRVCYVVTPVSCLTIRSVPTPTKPLDTYHQHHAHSPTMHRVSTTHHQHHPMRRLRRSTRSHTQRLSTPLPRRLPRASPAGEGDRNSLPHLRRRPERGRPVDSRPRVRS